MRRLVPPALAALAVALAAGCGGSSTTDDVSAAIGSLGKIRSGDLTLRLVVHPHAPGNGDVGFELSGPFRLAEGSRPAQADIRYTRLRGGMRATAEVVLRGGRGHVVSNGRTVELTLTQAQQLSSFGSAGSSSDPLAGLHVERWTTAAHRLSRGGLDVVRGGLDAGQAATDLIDLAARFGHRLPSLGDAERHQIRAAFHSGSVEVVSGGADHLLRDLLVRGSLGVSVPRQLQQALGTSVAADVEFELRIGHPNGH